MKCLITVGTALAILPSSVSTVKVNHLPKGSSPTLVLKLPRSQRNVKPQPSSCVTIVSDTRTMFSSSPVTTPSVVECLTTSSDTRQDISTVTTIAGKHAIFIVN